MNKSIEAIDSAITWFTCYLDQSMSRNNAEQLAEEVLDELKAAKAANEAAYTAGAEALQEAMRDAILTGTGVTQGGERIDPLSIHRR